MKLFVKCLVSILILALFSCKKEDPQPGLAKITLTGILLEKPNPNGRLTENQIWNHTLSDNFTLTFSSQESGETFSILLPSNPVGFSFELPLGTYSYESLSSNARISTTLPVELSGTLSAMTPEVTARLNGVSKYQLLSIRKANLESAPQILSPQTGVMASQGDFYYIYT